jgi:branched-subunit amino acid transport protein
MTNKKSKHSKAIKLRGSAVYRGAAAAWPICLGYAPIGLAFGVLAQKAGLTPLEIGLMSVIVFAGSSQFIAVSMLSAGASMISIVATAFVVNLRHFLMSSALAVNLKNSDRKKLTFFAYGVTDESFAVNLTKYNLPAWLVEWLDLIPAAILSALLLPELVTAGNPRFVDPVRSELIVAVPTFIFAILTKSLGGTVVVGMLLFWLAGKVP